MPISAAALRNLNIVDLVVMIAHFFASRSCARLGRYAAFSRAYQAALDRYDAVLFRPATSAIFGARLLFISRLLKNPPSQLPGDDGPQGCHGRGHRNRRFTQSTRE
jgi:hypothetical protein